ncbi:MAG TPA: hypothetical protein VNN74_05920 [Candidatus Micrarchaeia archaeon]|nr:hypothetical protein [Candidatus Micrarchaeia archaeon]
MEAQVPQPITASSTRFGPLTLPQLGWCGAAAAAPFILLVRWHLPLVPGGGLSLPTTLAGLAAAFARPDGRPAAAWCLDWARYRRRPRELRHPSAGAGPCAERAWRAVDAPERPGRGRDSGCA